MKSLHPMDLHFGLAVEHVAWCIRERWTPFDLFAAIEQPAPRNPTWNDAIWAVAKASEALRRPVWDLRLVA